MKKNNIIILLFCFFIVFLPAQAMAMVQTTGSASASMDSENKPDTTPKGFTYYSTRVAIYCKYQYKKTVWSIKRVDVKKRSNRIDLCHRRR